MARFVIVLALAAAFTAGCGPSYFGRRISGGQTAQSLSEILLSRRGSDAALSANLTLRIKGRVGNMGMNHRLLGEGVFTADKARASFKKAGLVSALSILAIGDNLTVYLPWNEKAYEGDVVKFIVERGSVPETFHLDPLAFFLPVVKGEVKSFVQSGKHYTIETDLGNGFRGRYILLVATGVMVTSDLIDPSGKVILRKDYERFTDIDGTPMPTVVQFNAPRGGVKGYLRAGRINSKPTIREGAFTIRIPPSIKVEKIGRKDAGDAPQEGASQ